MRRSICLYTAAAADTKHSNLLYNVLADSPWLGFTQIGQAGVRNGQMKIQHILRYSVCTYRKAEMINCSLFY